MDVNKIKNLEIYLDTTLKYKRLDMEALEILFYIKYKFQKYGEGREILKFIEKEKRKKLEEKYYKDENSEYVKSKMLLKSLKKNEDGKAIRTLEEILLKNRSEELLELLKNLKKRRSFLYRFKLKLFK
ncbi:MAG: hypothetical protein ACRDDY_01720 [Clostridium sp.]|uniref:hypothetical protein n=1 Tax=Clostridium sp. TaxID=1506 RepID=UPI003EE4D5E2